MATENKWYKKQDELLKKEPAAYDESVLGEPLRQMADNIVNRKPFSYDFATDPTYQQYEDRYIRAGKQAMRDTQGQAAQLSGGYGNSYAASAGQQAYQDYVSKLTAVIPQLYEAAFNRHQTDLAGQRADYAMMADREAQAYARNQDARNNWLQQLSLYGDMGNQERAFDYQKGRDAVADSQWQKSFDYQKAVDDRNYNLTLQQAAQRAVKEPTGNNPSGSGVSIPSDYQKTLTNLENGKITKTADALNTDINVMLEHGQINEETAAYIADYYGRFTEDAAKDSGKKTVRYTSVPEVKSATGRIPNITSKAQFNNDPLAKATYASFEDYLTDFVRRNS